MMRKLCLFTVLGALLGCRTTQRDAVTVYVSEDRVFSEPILKDFEKETGIQTIDRIQSCRVPIELLVP